MFNELFKAIYGWVSYSIYQKTVSTTIFRQLVPQKAAKGVGVYVLSKKTVSTAKGVGVSSEKYPKLHLVDVMSDTWYPIPPRKKVLNRLKCQKFVVKARGGGGGKSFKKPKKLLFPKSIHFLTTEILLPLIYL